MWQNQPPLTRYLLSFSISLSLGVYLEFTNPLKLYFNWPLICKGQLWRLITSIFYKGELSTHAIFDFFLFAHYSGQLEKTAFRHKPADYIMFLVFGCSSILFCAYIFGIQFLSSCLSSMMMYVWARKNPTIVINFLDVFQFRACYLPYFTLCIILLSGYDPTVDFLGAIVGHLYFFMSEIVP